jgi:ferredoxin-NADP reductase
VIDAVADARRSRRLEWQPARVVATRAETPHVRTLVFDVPGWPGHLAGQHLDLRLTAEDGYQAQRSYSIASAPGSAHVELTIERLDDGEVSPYLADVVREGDVIEVRGPIGGYFVWQPALHSPIALIAGGSGVVPLMAMLRHRADAGSAVPARLLYSARTVDELIYRSEIDRLAAAEDGPRVAYTLTRDRPAGWIGYDRRIDAAMLEETIGPPAQGHLIYVCGPTSMVEAVATLLVARGHAPLRVRTERFGPTGGIGS